MEGNILKIKEYKLYKSTIKTMKENNLIQGSASSNTKVLIDFSELENVLELSEEEKEIIKQDAIKNVCAYNRESFYGKEIDNFTSCIGIAGYYIHRVYRKDGKHLYNIMQLGKIVHTHTERESVYDSWESVRYEWKSDYSQPLNDHELE